MFAVDLYLRKTSPEVGAWVKGRYFDRVNDADRLRWFGAVVTDSGAVGVPLDQIRDVVLEAKGIRDHIAHSPGVAPIWSNTQWRLHVSHWNTPTIAKRAAAVPTLTNEEFRRQIARLSWAHDWISWFIADRKLAAPFEPSDDGSVLVEPPATPPA